MSAICPARVSTAFTRHGKIPDLRDCVLRALSKLLIENKRAALEFIPSDLRHLELFRDFHLEAGFYALFLLPPPRIDARDDDVILVDTPTRVAITRKPGAEVIWRGPRTLSRPQAQ